MRSLFIFAFCCVVTFAQAQPAAAADAVPTVFIAGIRIRHNPLMNTDGYLVTWLRKIPAAQVAAGPGDVIAVRGLIEINLTGLPAALRKTFRTALAEVSEGRRRVSGAWIDMSAATIMYHEPKPVALRYDPNDSFGCENELRISPISRR